MNIDWQKYLPTVKDFAERAAKTFAQAFLAASGVGGAMAGVDDIPWGYASGVGVVAVALSILTSLASLKVGNPGTASVTKAVRLEE